MAFEQLFTNPMGIQFDHVQFDRGTVHIFVPANTREDRRYEKVILRRKRWAVRGTTPLRRNPRIMVHEIFLNPHRIVQSNVRKSYGAAPAQQRVRQTMTGSIPTSVDGARNHSWAQVLSIPSCPSRSNHVPLAENRPQCHNQDPIWNSQQEWASSTAWRPFSFCCCTGVAGDCAESKPRNNYLRI